MQVSKSSQLFAASGAIMGWVGLVIQFWLSMENTQYPIPTTIVNYFSYFTILTNILTAVCFTFLAFNYRSGIGAFFTRPSVLTASTIHITIVGLIFNLILRPEIHSVGTQAWISDVLHVATPLLFIIYWVLCVPKNYYSWKTIAVWLLYPIVYLIYVLVRGPYADFYPYPFLDVRLWGLSKVLESCGIITVIYILFAAAFNHLSKHLAKKHKAEQSVV
jgi:hypothetical protein